MDDIISIIGRIYMAKHRTSLAQGRPMAYANTICKDLVHGVAETLREANLNVTVVFDSVLVVLLETDGFKLGEKGQFEKIFIHFDENLACIEHSEGREIFSSNRRLRDCFETQFDLSDPQSLDKLEEWLLTRKSKLQSCKD